MLKIIRNIYYRIRENWLRGTLVKRLLNKKSNGEDMQVNVNTLDSSAQEHVVVGESKDEIIRFLQKEIEHERREKEIYRDLYLKGEVGVKQESPDFSSFKELKTGRFVPWSIKRKKIEDMRRKNKKQEEESA